MINKIRDLIIEFCKIEYNVDLEESQVWINKSSNKEHGDFTSNVFLKFSKVLGSKPLDIAREFLIFAGEIDGVKLSVEKPGFLNISNKQGEFKLHINLSKIDISDNTIDEDINYLRERVTGLIFHYSRWNVKEEKIDIKTLFEIEREILDEVSALGMLGLPNQDDISQINKRIKRYFIEVLFNNSDEEFKEKRYYVLKKIMEFYNS